jgi:hypothetical protein
VFVCLNLSFVSLLRSPACLFACLFVCLFVGLLACLAQRQIVVFSSLIYFAEIVAVPVDSDGNATCVCAAAAHRSTAARLCWRGFWPVPLLAKPTAREPKSAMD